ncbi:MAG: sugar ABC transporter permease, partial [Clostridiales bacterium]|nr:sugar ABC transporter permease [Clostridiales bacterium]
IAIYVLFTVSNRAKRVKKEYEVEKFVPWIVKMIIISVVVGAFGFRLSQHKGIPNVLLIVIAIILFYSYITANTTVGRYFYAVGGNEKATKLSGINTNKVYFLAYTNMGLLAALAGMITIARLMTATAQSGQNYEMDAIASCFIGGASAYGGIGTVPGVIIGATLMGVINLGMNTMSVAQEMQQVVKGLVLLGAVIFDVVSKRGGKWIAKNT